MTDYFVGNLGQTRAYINKMNAFMGYPNPETKTTTYANPIEHKGKGNTHLVIIKEVHSPKLKRKAKIKDIDDNSNASDKSKRKTRRPRERECVW